MPSFGTCLVSASLSSLFKIVKGQGHFDPQSSHSQNNPVQIGLIVYLRWDYPNFCRYPSQRGVLVSLYGPTMHLRMTYFRTQTGLLSTISHSSSGSTHFKSFEHAEKENVCCFSLTLYSNLEREYPRKVHISRRNVKRTVTLIHYSFIIIAV